MPTENKVWRLNIDSPEKPVDIGLHGPQRQHVRIHWLPDRRG